MKEPELPEGMTYRVYHERKFRMQVDVEFMSSVGAARGMNEKIGMPINFNLQPKGGVTRVEIGYLTLNKDEEGQPAQWNVIAMGEAICSEKDSYNRMIGRRAALGRALKDLEGKPTTKKG